MDCSICAERITKNRYLVECPFCEDGSVCMVCAGKYIVSTEQGSIKPGERGCMICGKQWDLDYIEYMFGTKISNEYIDLHKRGLLEREKSLFVSTQPAVEYTKIKKSIIAETEALRKINRALRERMIETSTAIMANISRIRKIKPGIERPNYILACPSESECKGFIDSKTWSCNLCKIVVCNKCHVIASKNKETHRCKNVDVASVKLIMKDTKPCPGCASPIQKLEGCSQMFCTNCYVGFDWNTLEIVKTGIHNPHYYDLVSEGIINGDTRTAGDIPCGGIPDFRLICPASLGLGRPTILKLSLYHEFSLEILDYLDILTTLKPFPELLTDLRVKYILGEIESEEHYASELYELEIYIKKCKIEKDALDTLITIFAERFRDMIDAQSDIMNARITGRGNLLLPITERKRNMRKYFDDTINDLSLAIDMLNETFDANGIPLMNIPKIIDENYFSKDYNGFRSLEIELLEEFMPRPGDNDIWYMDD